MWHAAMEPPGTLPEKRVRKRSKRLSETDNTNGDAELTRKRPRRGTESSVNGVEGKRRGNKDRTVSSKVSVSVGGNRIWHLVLSGCVYLFSAYSVVCSNIINFFSRVHNVLVVDL